MADHLPTLGTGLLAVGGIAAALWRRPAQDRPAHVLKRPPQNRKD